MYILGVSCFYHDSSACILKDGEIIAAAAEERFTRKKHDIDFPINSIRFCLEHAGIGIGDVDHVAFYEKPLQKFERLLHQYLETFPRSWVSFCSSMPVWINERLRIPRLMRKRAKYKGDICFIEHHMCHAASSFFVSPYKEAAILTIDGVGEWATTTLGFAQGNEIELRQQIRFPHSIGLLYSAVTAHLGFKVNNSEYKVMGLSPYGDMDRKKNPYYRKLLEDVIDVKPDGSFALNMDYFVYHQKMRMVSKKFIREFGPIRKRSEEVTKRHMDIAAALQMVTEDVIMKLLDHLHIMTKCDTLCMAGGVALNSVMNGKILRNTPFKRMFIQPAAGDGGTSLGAALYLYHSVLGRERGYVQSHSYFGPAYSREEIKAFLKENGIKHSEFKSEKELISKTARLLAEDNVIGWFQGRMEWGPRALGSRSILASPMKESMKDVLNLKVKHREKFRPFAPVVCVEDASKYFECDLPIPAPADFMLMVYPIKRAKRREIPAVVHVDGSGRLQTIRKGQNPLYYGLIKEFGRITKTPILVNTSFNIRGEPIIISPFYAYRCMMGTGIDCLVMDRFLIRRDDNPQDMWDSEAYAKD
ncbi:MAG: carbamoyltransferase [Candidatus Aenigmarchaeota archaeon]|nr:carbamoyltransferase [Candidatus Aenigmarchaeota archaeon]